MRTSTAAKLDATADRDQRVVLHGVSWKQFDHFLGMRGDSSSVRIAYLEGELELMTPSFNHEVIKSTLGRLLEAWGEETDTDLTACGSWTVRKAAKKRGVEPDECYILGSRPKPRPDLAIEVVWTSGGLDKLEIYRGLGVPEVWIWQSGALSVFVLTRAGYAKRARSELLPALDLKLLARFVDGPSQPQAVKAFRRALRR